MVSHARNAGADREVCMCVQWEDVHGKAVRLEFTEMARLQTSEFVDSLS